MRRLSLAIAACVLTALSHPSTITGQVAESPPPPEGAAAVKPEPANKATTLRVLRTRELRRRFEPGVKLETSPVFEDEGPPVGNWLMFDLKFDGMPDSSRVMSVTVLSESAKDDLGTDLIATLTTRIGDDPIVSVERETIIENHGAAIRWYVAAPPRSASSIDGALVVRARVGAKRDELVIKPTKDWQKLEHPSFDGLNVEYCWTRLGGENTFLEVRPRGAEQYFYSVFPRPAHFRWRPRFSSSDSKGGAFLLAKGTPEGAEVRLQLHADITTIDATLTLTGHALP